MKRSTYDVMADAYENAEKILKTIQNHHDIVNGRIKAASIRSNELNMLNASSSRLKSKCAIEWARGRIRR